MGLPLYCELCGKPLSGKGRKVLISGAVLLVCDECAKFGEPIIEPKRRSPPPRSRRLKISGRRRRRFIFDDFDIVEDYADRIKAARKSLGWTKEILAEKVKEKVSVIRRIESGTMIPTLDLARKLESALGIKLLEPAISINISSKSTGKIDLTLGDVAEVKFKKTG